MQENYKRFGTEIGISPNGLGIPYHNLKSLIEAKFAEFQKESI